MSGLEGFLSGLGLDRYLSAFVENEVDLETLPALSDEDLQALGLPLGPRRKLQHALAELKETKADDQVAEGAGEPLVGERRPVTILFADLCRFSEISATLGAEDTHALLNSYFEKVDEIIERYGGAIDKHIGDCVMAVFGAPVAHSNDPERAIRAAQDIHDAMPRLGSGFAMDLASHIGIASGQVVASDTGSSRHRTYTITGESVNLASRLSDLAKAEETLVSQGVKQSVRRMADFRSKGQLSIKGFDEPIEVWQLSGLRDAPADLARRKLVGRTRECTQFSNLIDQVVGDGLGQTIFLRGEPGLGKTRLVEEFVSIAKARGLACAKASVLDFGVGAGRDPIRSLVAAVAALGSESGAEQRQGYIDGIVERGVIEDAQAVFLADLLNLPLQGERQSTYQAMDNAARNLGKQAVLAEIVRDRAARQPLLLLIEDIHWADPLTLAYVPALAHAVSDCPVLLVLTSRPEGSVMDQAWLTGFAPCPITTMELLPLRADEAVALAKEVSKLDRQALEDLVSRADGNPLFIEQLAQGGVEIAEHDLPDTLQGLVLARTDRLAAKDAFALKAASVIGNRFSLPLLCHLVGGSDFDCATLVEHRLIRVDGAEYIFGHVLIRDGVYSSLLRADRRRLHLAAAAWFERDDPFLHAQHLHRAEDAGAVRAYLAAADAFERQQSLERAIEAARLGGEIATDPVDECVLLLTQGRLLHDVGQLEDAGNAYQRALDGATTPYHACRARIGLAAVMRVTDHLDQAWQQLEHAETLAVAEDLNLERAEIHELRGNLCFPLGKVEQCLQEHKLGLDFARKAQVPRAIAQSLGGVGDAYYASGMLRSANELYVECIAFTDKHGLERIKNANLSGLAATRKYMLDLQTAIEECREAARISTAIGAKRSLINALHSEIELLIERMELDLGDQKISQAMACIEELGARRFMARSLHYKGRVLMLRDEPVQAHSTLQEALAVSLATGTGYVGPTIASSLALSSPDSGERAKYLKQGLDLLQKGAVAHNTAEYYRDAIEIALIEKRWADVPGLAQQLRAFAPESLDWIDFWAARGETIASLEMDPADAASRARLEGLCAVAARVGLRTALPAMQRLRD